MSRLPTGLLLAEDTLPYSLGVRRRFVLERIEPGGWRELNYPIVSGTRGKFTIGPLQVRVTDAFGLVELTRSFAARSTLVVTPPVIPLPAGPLAGSWRGEGGGGRTRTADTAGEDDVIPRPYRDGDELRRVHWRSTARHGELMVRREEQHSRNRAVLLLDTRTRAHSGPGAGSSFEFAASAMASIGVYLARAGLDGQLVTDQGPVSAPGSFEDTLLDSLAVIKQSRGSNLARGLDQVTGGTGGLFLVVAGRLSAEEARRLAAARRDTGPAMALLLAVSTWAPPAGRLPADPAEVDVAAGTLRAAGWRVVTVTADTSLPAAWNQLRYASELPGYVGRDGRASGGRPMSNRMTLAAALATLAASLSLYPVVDRLALVLGRVRRGDHDRRGWRADPAAAAAGRGVRAGRAGRAAAVPEHRVRQRQVGRPGAADLGFAAPAARAGQPGAAGHQPVRAARAAPYPAIVILAVTGIGVVAVATDLIAVRLRRPARGRAAAAGAVLRAADRQRAPERGGRDGRVLPGHGGVPDPAGGGRAGTAAAVGPAGHGLAARDDGPGPDRAGHQGPGRGRAAGSRWPPW